MEWISVKDRLPKENLFVLIAGECENHTFVGYFDLQNGWCNYLHEKTTVTHWMPLPEVPNDSNK